MKDYYTILEVPPTASQTAIREQYRLLIQAWHPDKFSGADQKAKAEERCKEINVAYGVLKDTRKRAQYDRELAGRQSRSPQSARSRSAERQPAREQAEEVHWKGPDEERRESGAAAGDLDHTRREDPPWDEQEWIRIYFKQARRRHAGEAAARVKHAVRVLIVDDVANRRADTRSLLSSAPDIRVVGEVSRDADALAQFESLLPDVLIVSVNLPNLDGFAITEAVRRKHPTAKVIVLSAQTSVGEIQRAAMAGACDYLTQLHLADELIAAVRLAAERPV